MTTFLQKFEALKKSIPTQAVNLGPFSHNCEMCDWVFQSKNCQFCFDCVRLEDSLYCSRSAGKNLVDCTGCVECELCYQSLNSNKSYGSTYIIDCDNCTSCHFCSLCHSCSDCFGCVGLTNKKYCIFNKQYTATGYKKAITNLIKKRPEEILKKILELGIRIPRPQSIQLGNQNCPYGDYIHNSVNGYWCFNSYYVENSGFIFDGGYLKNCYDITFGEKLELCYEVFNSGPSYNCMYLIDSSGCTNCYYCCELYNCTDCFGCTGLTNKKYCILNNQLTKSDYEKAVVQIKKELGWE